MASDTSHRGQQASVVIVATSMLLPSVAAAIWQFMIVTDIVFTFNRVRYPATYLVENLGTPLLLELPVVAMSQACVALRRKEDLHSAAWMIASIGLGVTCGVMTLSSCVALLITFPGIDDNVSVPNFLGHLIIHAPGVFAACLATLACWLNTLISVAWAPRGFTRPLITAVAASAALCGGLAISAGASTLSLTW